MPATKEEMSDLIKANNDQLMASFKELLNDTARQIKHANKPSAEHADERDRGNEISRTTQV